MFNQFQASSTAAVYIIFKSVEFRYSIQSPTTEQKASIKVELHLLHDSWLSPLRHWLSADSSFGMVGDRLEAPPVPAFCIPDTAVPASFAVYRFASSWPLLTFFLKRMRLLPNQFDTWNRPQLHTGWPGKKTSRTFAWCYAIIQQKSMYVMSKHLRICRFIYIKMNFYLNASILAMIQAK